MPRSIISLRAVLLLSNFFILWALNSYEPSRLDDRSVPVPRVTFYITPTNSSNPDCPHHTTDLWSAGDPHCVTLDNFTKYELPLISATGKELTLIFLKGIHKCTIPIKIDGAHSFTMQGTNDSLSLPTIQLLSGSINVAVSDHMNVSQLRIRGSNGYALIVTVKDENVSISLSQSEMLSILLQIAVKILIFPSIKISNVIFTASVVEIYAGYSYTMENKGVTIKDSTFQIIKEQPYMIALCPKLIASYRDTDDPKIGILLQLENVKVQDDYGASLKYTSSQAPRVICNTTHFSNQFTSDIYFGNLRASVNLTIANSHFSRSYGSAIHSKYTPSHSIFKIYNSYFTGYTWGALVFSGDLSYVIITLINVIIANNSISTEGTRAAGLAIIPAIFPKDPLNIELKECHFQQNIDHAGNLQIILLYGISEFMITNSTFTGNNGTVINAKETNITFTGDVLFENNTAWQGGALSLSSSAMTIHDYTTVNFNSNHAVQFGGAIFIENDQFYLQNDASTQQFCFYQPSYPSYNFIDARITFSDNSADEGGDCIYGTSIRNYCMVKFQEHQYRQIDYWKNLFQIDWSMSFSTVSSRALRVCLCDTNGHPQCTDTSKIFSIYNRTVYPGEVFPISAVVVGAEFGTTVGEVHAKLLDASSSALASIQESFNLISTPFCTSLNYSIHSSNPSEIICLTSTGRTQKYYGDTNKIEKAIDSYNVTSVIPYSLMSTPVFINITLRKCPAGFIMMNNPSYCECYLELSKFNVICTFSEGKGYISREGSNWVGAQNSKNSGIIFNDLCPFDHCNQSEVSMNLAADNGSHSDAQCVFSHSGLLCGGCKKGYSVAIGSSHCLNCTNNNNLALVILFAAAGPLLYIIIATLDLTITRGHMNGLIFYANIVWVYQSIVFTDSNNQPYQTILYAFKIFMAWLNLDFGIETCFIKGLDAFWKSLLQYIFPLYIWFIAWLVKAAYSCISIQYLQDRHPLLAKIAGKPVDVLITFIFLSYTKLLRTIVAAFAWATLTYYPQNSTKLVWAVDGNIDYLKDTKHIVVLIFAFISLILTLWYTIYVFFAGLESCLYIICHKNQSEITETTAARKLQGWCKRVLYPVATLLLSKIYAILH